MKIFTCILYTISILHICELVHGTLSFSTFLICSFLATGHGGNGHAALGVVEKGFPYGKIVSEPISNEEKIKLMLEKEEKIKNENSSINHHNKIVDRKKCCGFQNFRCCSFAVMRGFQY